MALSASALTFLALSSAFSFSAATSFSTTSCSWAWASVRKPEKKPAHHNKRNKGASKQRCVSKGVRVFLSVSTSYGWRKFGQSHGEKKHHLCALHLRTDDRVFNQSCDEKKQ